MYCSEFSDSDIKQLCDSEQLIIQKAHPLLALWKSPLTLPEFKILDLYLSRIDSRHPENRHVHFTKGEIEHLLNVTHLKPDHLKARLRNLCIAVEIPNRDYPRGFDMISLFERAVCIPDEDGIWQIDLECTKSAMKYIFNVENIGYIKYKLQAICNLMSRYSYVLFLYLEQNRFRGSWEEELDVLREILGCTSDFYKSYKQFNQHVLRRSHSELLMKTECKFSYSPIRIGRRVRKVRFQMEGPVPELLQPEQLPAPSAKEQEADYIELMRTACCDPETREPEFSHFEMKYILQVLRQVPTSVLAHCASGENDRFAMYHYLTDRYGHLNQRAETEAIQDRLLCLVGMIREDIRTSKK